jgi:DNA-binding response OmpR family regulator
MLCPMSREGVAPLLVGCSLINGMQVKRDDEHATVIVDNCLLRFTPTEYKLVRLLLTDSVVPEASLFAALSLQKTDKTAAKLLTKYINKIRGKLAAHGVCLSRVHGYGYMLLPNQEEDLSLLEAIQSENMQANQATPT